MKTKYPNITVTLCGQDGNAFAILGAVTKAMKRAGLDETAREEYEKEATSGDYDHLLQTTMRYVNVD